MNTTVTMDNIKLGLRVRSRQPGLEYTGTVVKLGPDNVVVRRDDGNHVDWYCLFDEDGRIATTRSMWDGMSHLELIDTDVQSLINKSIKIMQRSSMYLTTLTERQKSTLDADTQAFIEGGVLNASLDLTSSGSSLLLGFLFDDKSTRTKFAKHVAELVATAKKEQEESEE